MKSICPDGKLVTCSVIFFSLRFFYFIFIFSLSPSLSYFLSEFLSYSLLTSYLLPITLYDSLWLIFIVYCSMPDGLMVDTPWTTLAALSLSSFLSSL